MISVDNVTKEYKINKNDPNRSFIKNLLSNDYIIKKAVKNISFKIADNEIVGYIGRNGAGKSTTIKMLSGILVPTGGEIQVNGIIPYKERKKHTMKIGTVFGQKTQLWWDLPVIESFKMLKYIYKIPDKIYKNNLDEFVEILEMKDYLNRPVRQLSLGQRIKSDIAAALLHNPSILFLDEPTIGVDILSKENLHNFILKIKKERDTTVLLTTHDIGDIQILCSRIIVIDDGEKIFDGSLEKIQELYGENRSIVVEFANKIPDEMISNTVILKKEGKSVWYSFDRAKISATDIISLIIKKYEVTDIKIVEPNLEDIIRIFYRKGVSIK